MSYLGHPLLFILVVVGVCEDFNLLLGIQSVNCKTCRQCTAVEENSKCLQGVGSDGDKIENQSSNVSMRERKVQVHTVALFYIVYLLELFWTNPVSNTPWKKLYGHLPPILETIYVIRTRYVEHCWRSKEKLLWTPTQRRSSVSWPARTYLHQLCADTECSLKDQSGATADRDGWKEKERPVLSARLDNDENALLKLWTTLCN